MPNTFEIQKHKNSTLTPINIGRELGVDNIIQSNIMKIGNQFKISLQIISLENGDIVLQKSWDGGINDYKNIFGTLNVLDQFEISSDEILSQDLNRDLNIDKQAYELFLKGSYLCNHVKSKRRLY